VALPSLALGDNGSEPGCAPLTSGGRIWWAAGLSGEVLTVASATEPSNSHSAKTGRLAWVYRKPSESTGSTSTPLSRMPEPLGIPSLV